MRTGRRSTTGHAPRSSPDSLTKAWDAWRDGDFLDARRCATKVLALAPDSDEARHVLVLVASVRGQFDDAIATYRQISSRYLRLKQLDEPMLWNHVHSGDLVGALEFAAHRHLTRREAIGKRLRLAVQHPFEAIADGVVEVAFTNDRLTPLMPGFDATLNGRPTVARLDTGGAYVHMSSGVAAAHHVVTTVSTREFAALGWHTVRHGVADMGIGGIALRNVPVAVHEGALPIGAIADAFDVELGPIIGTNVLQRFLATIDGPSRRLVVSRRGDVNARRDHLALLTGEQHEVAFGLWGDHFMIVRGSVGPIRSANLFVDTGLVVYTDEHGQAAALLPRNTLGAWGVAQPCDGVVSRLPGGLGVGELVLDEATAYAVPDQVWRDFGDWGGVRVDALISWGYLRDFAWTIDFDAHRYLLGRRPTTVAG